MPTYIGIDPGLDGAIAVIRQDGPPRFYDTPTITVAGKGKAAKNKREYDAMAIVGFFQLLGHDLFVTIERQQAMPASLQGRTQGTVSSFRTGLGFGIWLGILAGLGIPHQVIASVSWKKQLMKDCPKEKSASILKACQLFPQASPDLKRKKDHGRADALLIGEYGRRMMASV